MKTMILAVLFLAMAGFAYSAEPQNKAVSLTVLSEGVMFDGVPSEFDIKLFAAKLNKELASRLDDKGFPVSSESYKYKLKVDIDSVAHKLRPFHFKVQYLVKYKYSLSDSDKKELLKEKDVAINEDQSDLIDELSEDVIKKIIEATT
jgi:hypothetical protein